MPNAMTPTERLAVLRAMINTPLAGWGPTTYHAIEVLTLGEIERIEAELKRGRGA